MTSADQANGQVHAAAAARSSADLDRELARLRYALAATGIGVWTWDPDADAIWWSDEVHPLFGIAREAVPRTVADFYALIDETDRELVRQIIDTEIAGGRDFAAEFRVRAAGDEPRWLMVRGQVERRDDGSLGHAHGIVADVSVRRRADEILRLNEARYRALVFATADVVWTMTGEGGHQVEERLIGLADRTWAAFTGQSEEEVYTQGWLAAVHPEDRARAAAAWEATLARGDGFEQEYRVRRRDGVYRLLADRGVPLRDDAGRIVQWIGAAVDITERREEEARQRFLATAGAALVGALDYETAIQELARLIVPAVADACVIDVLEPGGAIRPLVSAASPATLAVLDELRVRYPATLDRQGGVARVIRTGEPSLIPVVSDDDRLAVALNPEHLGLLRALGTRSNITVPLVARGEIVGAMTLKRIQSEVPYGPADLTFAEELAFRAALALDNARLLREARAAVQLRDDLLSSASHDLRNPLTTIQGRIQMLRRRAERDGGRAPEQMAHDLDEIVAAAGKLQAMIEELQDLSSLQIGRPLSLRRQWIDLITLAREEMAEIQRNAPRHDLRLLSDRQEVLADIDPIRFRRVLDNLLANAVKYSPDGGEVSVTVGVEEAESGRWATIAVQDHGVGIPRGDLPHLFERFYRASNVAGHFAGTGIGLAGSRQIVAQHGGTISVESEEGHGSTFTVRLPLVGAGDPGARVETKWPSAANAMGAEL